MGKLEGRIALITAGNSGIDLATAKQFVNESTRAGLSDRGRRKSIQAAGINPPLSRSPDRNRYSPCSGVRCGVANVEIAIAPDYRDHRGGVDTHIGRHQIGLYYPRRSHARFNLIIILSIGRERNDPI